MMVVEVGGVTTVGSRRSCPLTTVAGCAEVGYQRQSPELGIGGGCRSLAIEGGLRSWLSKMVTEVGCRR